MTSLGIRRLERRDIDGIAAAFGSLGWDKPRSQYERYLREQGEGARTVLVAFREGAFAGYVSVAWRSDHTHLRADGIPEIKDLNVLPRFRRRGIGTRLLDAAEALVDERSGVVGLGVGLSEDYGAAQRLYVLRGYVPEGRGLNRNGVSVHLGESVIVDHDLVLSLTKTLQGRPDKQG